MGKSAHLSFEALSALADGELAPLEATAAASHLDSCLACRSELRGLERLDAALQQPLPDPSAAWEPLYAAIRALPPSHPSARVDRAVGLLTSEPARGLRPTGALPVLALRTGIAAVLALAIALASVLAAGRPEVAELLPPELAAVASAQEVLLNPRTNTLYVADPANGVVNALNATTHQVIARIAVGGRPTALALNQASNTIYVLDPSQKLLTYIDGSRNEVTATSTMAVSGTPTSLQVSPSGEKIVVAFAAATTAASTPQPSAGGAGSLAIIDARTKAVETVRAVDVSPRLVVLGPSGARALLVSPSGTSVVDAATFEPTQQLPGAVAAAFSADGSVIGLVTADARVLFFGNGDRSELRVDGAPLAILRADDGFAVLVERAGAGRIVVLGADLKEKESVSVALVGRDVLYDAASHTFTVVGPAAVATAVSAGAIAQPSPTPPRPSAAPSAAPSAPPAGSAAPSSPSPSPLPSLAVRTEPPVAFEPVALGVTRMAGPPGRLQIAAHAAWGRMWSVDQFNAVVAVDMATGRVAAVAQLPEGTQASAIGSSSTHLFVADASNRRLHAIRLHDGRRSMFDLPPLPAPVSVTGAPDGRAWLASPGSATIFALDPVTARIEAVGLPRGAVRLAADAAGRIWAADANGSISRFDPKLNVLVEFPGRLGLVTDLQAVGETVWVGTAAGEVYRVGEKGTSVMASLGAAVTALEIGPGGAVWSLSPTVGGFSYGAVGTGTPRVLAAPVIALGFDSQGRAWLADALGASYVTEALR